jgi:hypothetical protein
LYFIHRYDEQIKERESQIRKEDLSDMVAEHAAKQKVRFNNLLVKYTYIEHKTID